MRQPLPPTIAPHTKPLSIGQSIKAARRNVLEIIPAIAYRQPIVTGRMAMARWHMVQEPAALRRVFLDNVANYPKSEVMLRMLRPAVGDSLFTLEGAEWRWQRRAVAPVFAQRNVVALAPVMTATAERATARLMAAGGQAEMVEEMLSATFDVICEVALSGREHFDAKTYGAAILRYFETAGKASLLDFLRVPGWVPRPGELLGAGAVRTMHDMVARAIEERRRQVQGGADDLLDHMLSARDKETGRTMTPEDLLHNMQFFIVAGHETTALALSWSLLMLAQHPELQSRAREEARGVLGNRAAGADDLEHMPFISQVLEEAMRLYPPVGMLAREVLADDRLAGRDIHANDVLFLPIYALHRHELYWERPNAFDPDRFSAEARAGRDRYLYLPFGAGPRVCVGANFAMMQAQIILATLLARFAFDMGEGPLPLPTMSMTVRPEPGVTLRVAPL
ncbi:cytochrome P450 [Arsenicitalea aurantiaca]|uniref:Cytochrome P450 n=1 Tax=Arsenicitalea aurantiaca TaxID=1783274 RepID=A0A433XBI2_9HYPH|nr:cytochrome P450 [Arsenicitalea aurantiaca]